MEFFKKTPTVAFMANRRWCYIFSAILILSSAVLLATRGLNRGIDFTGGVELELRYPDTVNVESARTAIAQAGYADVVVAPLGTDRDLLVRTKPGKDENTNQVSAKILQTLRAATPTVELRRTEVVGPQVGRELSEKGGLALLFTFIMILIYVGFRFEKKMAAGTVLAAMHDPILILGFFSATQLTFDLSVLAAVLAVIGYSINDTVVVFDRVRENFLGMRKVTPAAV
ncbi:MAG: protein translocase subunit SecF, partial [Candidatus Obscuribacterales bacterium]|nr:protein translocase subunit SecF [Steroidobacteraceae bacterium]